MIYIIIITSFLKELNSKIIIHDKKNDRDNTMLSESLGNCFYIFFLKFTF